MKDINPGPLGSLPPGATELTALPHSAVLSASNGLTGLELWKTNGEGVGTILVQEIFLGPGSSTPRHFRQAANQLFLTADDGSHGRELWVMPLQAVGVSLEEQIDELLLLLKDPATMSAQWAQSLTTLLETARRLISLGNNPGNLLAARAHLMNFISGVQRLIENGDIAANKGKSLLEGAQAILEQIEGNRPVRQPFFYDLPSLSESGFEPSLLHSWLGQPHD